MVKMLREKTDLKMAAIAGRLCEGHVALRTPHAVLQNKSAVCSGSRVTNSTVTKLRGSVNRGGITVKTYKEHLLTLLLYFKFKLVVVAAAVVKLLLLLLLL